MHVSRLGQIKCNSGVLGKEMTDGLYQSLLGREALGLLAHLWGFAAVSDTVGVTGIRLSLLRIWISKSGF